MGLIIRAASPSQRKLLDSRRRSGSLRSLCVLIIGTGSLLFVGYNLGLVRWTQYPSVAMPSRYGGMDESGMDSFGSIGLGVSNFEAKFWKGKDSVVVVGGDSREVRNLPTAPVSDEQESLAESEPGMSHRERAENRKAKSLVNSSVDQNEEKHSVPEAFVKGPEGHSDSNGNKVTHASKSKADDKFRVSSDISEVPGLSSGSEVPSDSSPQGKSTNQPGMNGPPLFPRRHSIPDPPSDPDRLKIYRSCQKQELGFPTCPTIQIIGCQKCGTTNFAYWMTQIPEVVFGDLGGEEPTKEMHFFDSGINFGVEEPRQKPRVSDEVIRKVYNEYVNKFPIRNASDTFSLDATPEHIYQHTAAASFSLSGIVNMQKTRFFFLVRDPVARFQSAVHMMRKDFEIHGRDYGRGEEFVKLNWNLSTIAERCIPVIKRCRSQALEKHLDPLVECHGSEAIHRDDPCSTLYRGIYVDQLSTWLRYFPAHMFCIVELNMLSKNPGKALTDQAGRCLKDVGVDFSVLVKSIMPIPVKRSYDKLEKVYPGLRQRLEKELYNETNDKFRSLVRQRWGIEKLDL